MQSLPPISNANLGASYLGDGRCHFQVWAPLATRVEVHLLDAPDRYEALEPRAHGYYEATVEGVTPGAQYRFRLDGDKEYADPASRFQPQGVHGPSQVTEPAFPWRDGGWSGITMAEQIIYELHIGTFTAEGTFEAAIERLPDLVALGVTAIEIMPVAQFPGDRNWGYDGVFPYATQHSYGGPEGLKRLVDACHQAKLAVVLDVVYNHLGPEGNCLPAYGPYFNDLYSVPWGQAINFDGAQSDAVRRYFIENALYWTDDLHIDALRLDAVHAIYDSSALHFLEELSIAVEERAQALGRRIQLIAESDLNNPRLVQPRARGGYGLDAQWCDDLHHALHALLTKEDQGYYSDYGSVEQLAATLAQGYAFTGQYSEHRQRRHGRPPNDIAPSQLVVCSQNHDQVGNRMIGDRLTTLVSYEALKLAAGVVLLSPFTPLLFMGEEYGEEAPFPFFVHHTKRSLINAVRKGRSEEFASFHWQGEPPDPQARATYLSAKLHWQMREEGKHQALLAFYQELIRIRKETLPLADPQAPQIAVQQIPSQEAILLHYQHPSKPACIVYNLSGTSLECRLPLPPGTWRKLLDSADEQWQGTGSGLPLVVDTALNAMYTLHGYQLVLFSQ